MAALANGKLPNLQSLNIGGCDEITDSGVTALANGKLPNLQSLNITYCSNITDSVVTAIFNRFPNVTLHN